MTAPADDESKEDALELLEDETLELLELDAEELEEDEDEETILEDMDAVI